MHTTLLQAEADQGALEAQAALLRQVAGRQVALNSHLAVTRRRAPYTISVEQAFAGFAAQKLLALT